MGELVQMLDSVCHYLWGLHAFAGRLQSLSLGQKALQGSVHAPWAPIVTPERRVDATL